MAAGQEGSTSDTKCLASVHSCYDSKGCDGPGDCLKGQVCCLEQMGVGHGSCTDGNDDTQERFVCKPAVPAATPCRSAEICSALDPGCTRPGSSCVVDEKNGRGTCEVPRQGRPTCGAAPCARGQSCVESPSTRKRSCVKDDAPHQDWGLLIECDGARHCAPDETCYASGGRGQICQLNYVDVFNDRPVCQSDSDCAISCQGSEMAFCVLKDNRPVGRCECRPRCQRDQDCRSWNCRAVAFSRFGSSVGAGSITPLCNKKQHRCDCNFD